jgi:hypothetical protein
MSVSVEYKVRVIINYVVAIIVCTRPEEPVDIKRVSIASINIVIVVPGVNISSIMDIDITVW